MVAENERCLDRTPQKRRHEKHTNYYIKRARNGPSRRHILESKIVKGFERVKYSFLLQYPH